MEQFIWLMLGHILADFFCQTQIMSDQKWRPGMSGHLWCSIHVVIYTFVLAIWSWQFDIVWAVLVFLPHWIIDRFGLALWWMNLTGMVKKFESPEPHNPAFGAIVYVVLDQWMHSVCLYAVSIYVN